MSTDNFPTDLVPDVPDSKRLDIRRRGWRANLPHTILGQRGNFLSISSLRQRENFFYVSSLAPPGRHFFPERTREENFLSGEGKTTLHCISAAVDDKQADSPAPEQQGPDGQTNAE